MNQEGFNPDKEMEKMILEHINCSLPWSSYKVQELQECKTETDFNNYLIALQDLQKKLKRVDKKCSYKTWKLFPISEQTLDGNTSINFQVVLTSEDSITIEKEVYVYTLAYFIGTFGGYLGLFLGGSILGYLDSIETFIYRKFEGYTQ